MVDNMEWFNVFGLIFIAVIMIPNVVFAIKCKDGFDNKWNNKYVEVTEQVGRLGCFGFMIINIPGTWFGWWSDEAFALYLIVDTILVMLYCAIWIICFKKNSVFRALALSIIPSMLFLFSGIMSRSVLLIIASVLFAPSHIVISYKNVKWYLPIQVCRIETIDLYTRTYEIAVDLAEKQLREGTASSQVITHYLKMGSTKERIEQEIREKQKELISAKTEVLQSSKRIEELYSNAIKAMRRYSGHGDENDQ